MNRKKSLQLVLPCSAGADPNFIDMQTRILDLKSDRRSHKSKEKMNVEFGYSRFLSLSPVSLFWYVCVTLFLFLHFDGVGFIFNDP